MARITLKRRCSGFVKYPKDFEKRIATGTARFRTRCDMLVGPCACGCVHQEDDQWVQDTLCQYDAEIETWVLQSNCYGEVKLPRYWLRPSNHNLCTVLIGRCACGKIHIGSEKWVLTLLKKHNAVIEHLETNTADTNDADDLWVMSDRIAVSIPGVLEGCNCGSCEELRDRYARRQQCLNRNQI